MLIGRADDPQNPGSPVAIKAAHPFGRGSRNPSGPAAGVPRKTGRTHDCHRTRSDFLALNPCTQGAVHTRATSSGRRAQHPRGHRLSDEPAGPGPADGRPRRGRPQTPARTPPPPRPAETEDTRRRRRVNAAHARMSSFVVKSRPQRGPMSSECRRKIAPMSSECRQFVVRMSSPPQPLVVEDSRRLQQIRPGRP